MNNITYSMGFPPSEEKETFVQFSGKQYHSK
jgi:hypothetical protein